MVKEFLTRVPEQECRGRKMMGSEGQEKEIQLSSILSHFSKSGNLGMEGRKQEKVLGRVRREEWNQRS